MVFSQPIQSNNPQVLLSGLVETILHFNGAIIPIINSLLLLGIIPASLIYYLQQPVCGCRRPFSKAKLVSQKCKL